MQSGGRGAPCPWGWGPPDPMNETFGGSLSEENTGERGSSVGSPRGSPVAAAADKAAAAAGGAAGAAAAAAGDKEGAVPFIRSDSRERGPSASSERGPPSSLPLHSRLGDLRRRLQSKRAEPVAQQQ
ncbi:uncharacterized protein EMH_0063000 [Eimeria mitis]|uniref:Uncharacterized protein n=1 Tax=Eimeria mitis TaxID=44415 RepID=U6K675_9EIME|nr:uncharacterized protein EMH_0063000 [Eimeria mitis]CDJ30983.1 hypothetical protein EMH_0063000 [Eimeria mitis]